MTRIQMYTTRWCGYCVRAKALLDSRGLPYEEISLDDDPAFRQRLEELTGGWTVPQILIDGEPIGGYTQLLRLDPEGGLQELLPARAVFAPAGRPGGQNHVPRPATRGFEVAVPHPAPGSPFPPS